MRSIIFLTAIITICACGGGLSDEQRKSLQKEMKEREIKKVQEEDIVAKTFNKGQQLIKEYLSGRDSLKTQMRAEIYIIEKGDSVERKKDWEVFEAYKYALTHGAPLSDNVQRDEGMMIYTHPLVIEDEFNGIYVVRIPRKALVLEL